MDNHGDGQKPVDGWREHEAWALSIARPYGPRPPLSRGDLEQIARIAVWRAWERYRPGEGAAFRTYAIRFVRGAVLRAYRDTSGVPSYQYERGARLQTVESPDRMDADKAAWFAVSDRGFERVELGMLLDRLTDRERLCLVDRASGFGPTETGRRIGLHHENVQRALRSARIKMMAMLEG